MNLIYSCAISLDLIRLRQYHEELDKFIEKERLEAEERKKKDE